MDGFYNIPMTIHLGCPIWSFKGWVGNFYPRGTKPADFLREYARRLTTIEGNTTFYAVPSQKTVAGWMADTPETFRFCPKIPKAISHEGKLIDNLAKARAFIDVMRQLDLRLGPMFLQLPPRFSPNQIDDLKAFLAAWPAQTRLAVEVRHQDWFESPHDELLDQLLAGYSMARVVIDTRPIRSLAGDEILKGSVYQALIEARERKPDLPVAPKRTCEFVFIRYIGHPDLEINRPFLDEWAEYITTHLRQGAEVYMFCHSPDNLAAPFLCRELHGRVSRELSLPPLPWDGIERNAQQPRLL